jgi:hypothetical protein
MTIGNKIDHAIDAVKAVKRRLSFRRRKPRATTIATQTVSLVNTATSTRASATKPKRLSRSSRGSCSSLPPRASQVRAAVAWASFRHRFSSAGDILGAPPPRASAVREAVQSLYDEYEAPADTEQSIPRRPPRASAVREAMRAIADPTLTHREWLRRRRFERRYKLISLAADPVLAPETDTPELSLDERLALTDPEETPGRPPRASAMARAVHLLDELCAVTT